MNYTQEARRIITDCFAALKPSEQLRTEAARELQQGHITEGYARELTASATNEALNLRRDALAQLDAEPTSPTRGDAYWNMLARDIEPWATL